ncbi:cytochrome P450 [Meira miltonrushii]|uniref:Cytochrome P450 n=1 Tax=Meira miltonrushii TaxID=1280837 RepID=A0A316VAF0_9BASI|nr:cytochrome P450 [Meira miltonrushii]PWN34599.1 cytochrome P450 [Meira miltonrushii]
MSLFTSIAATVSLLLLGKLVFSLLQFWIAPYLSPLRKLPGPPAKHWYFGWTTPDVMFGLSANISQKHEEYGTVFYGRGIHRVPTLYIADEVAANYVFQNQFSSNNPELFRQVPFLVRAARAYFGSTILGVEEDVHRRQRRAMLPAFTESSVRQASPVMYEVTQDLMDLMRKDLAGKAEYTQTDALIYVRDATLDIMGRAGFGRDLGALNKKTTKLNKTFHGLVAMLTSPSYYALLRFRIPWIRYIGKYVSEEEVRFREFRKGIEDHADDLVKTAEHETKSGYAEEDRNVLRLIKRNSANGFSDKELREAVPIMLLAGYETSATTIAWAIHVLRRDVEGLKRQARLRAELNADEFQGWQSDFSVLNGMPYLDAVCTEVLRLYPAIASINRICWQDTVIPLSRPITLRDGTTTDKVPIKKGEYIYISAASVNRNASVWGKNANEFLPERWLRDDHIYFDASLVSNNNSQLGGWNRLMTFGQGLRMCLGFRFALAEFKILLAYCIANFDWQAAIDAKSGKSVEIESRGQNINKTAIKGAERNQYSLPVLVKEIK